MPATHEKRVTPPIEDAMRRALDLAARGPSTGANPQVGCIILSPAGDIISQGWHRGHGTAHAEVDALSRLSAEQTLGATAIVTLEPCNHQGTTGPCSEALIAAGVSHVFFAVNDPNPAARDGAARLRDAGVHVVSGVLADEVAEFLHPWLNSVRQGRPYVTLKWASSLDGRAAAADGSSQWITGESARDHVHEQRAKADAIVVGTGTVLADDPSLTARTSTGELLPHQPIPVVVGERSIPADALLYGHPHPLIETGTRDLDTVLNDLFVRGIRRAFVEGGPTVASAFIAAGLVDEYFIYFAPKLIGGSQLALGDLGIATLPDARMLTITSIEQLGEDILVRARPKIEEG